MIEQDGVATIDPSCRTPSAPDGHLRSIDALSAAGRRPNRMAYASVRAVTRGLGRRWNLSVAGAENLPRSGPLIVAANHVSFIDSPLLMFCLPRRIWFLGKAEYMDSWKTRHLFPAVGMIPLPRGAGAAPSRRCARHSTSSPTGRPSASIPRARAAATESCTVAIPGWGGSR